MFGSEYMDEDIRNALFEDEDELGLFEELDDDFVAQVSTNAYSIHDMIF